MIKLFAFTHLTVLMLVGVAYGSAEGTAVGVNPDASARDRSTERVLVVGSDVSIGDRIVTGPSGRVQLLFDDQTRIVVGPRSELEIEAYLLNGSTADTFAVNALAGTFRFISGTSPKPVYSIDTPTASIAVRGTKFDVTVAGDTSGVMLFEGALTICRQQACVDLVRRCDIGIVSLDQAVKFEWNDPERVASSGYFPLPNIQSAFLPEFRIQGAQACLAMPPLSGNGSLIEGGGPGTATPPPNSAGGGRIVRPGAVVP